MRDMRRLVRRTEDRFAQPLRIIRQQEDNLRDMNRAMKRQKRDEDDDRRQYTDSNTTLLHACISTYPYCMLAFHYRLHSSKYFMFYFFL